jgi:hypothetical protein
MTGRAKPHYTDVLLPTAVRVWYRLHADGCRDLHQVSCAHDSVGAAPEWWEEGDLETAVALNRLTCRVKVGGFEVHHPWLRWALRNGIAPGQAFLVGIPEPIYSGDGEDYDEEWEYVVLERAPSNSAAIQRRWEVFSHRLAMHRALAAASYFRGIHLVQADTGAMYLRHTNYRPSSDTYGFPRGVLLSLCTSRREHIDYLGYAVSDGYQLASGRDDRGGTDTAMARLIEVACERYPALSPQVIQSMRVRH